MAHRVLIKRRAEKLKVKRLSGSYHDTTEEHSWTMIMKYGSGFCLKKRLFFGFKASGIQKHPKHKTKPGLKAAFFFRLRLNIVPKKCFTPFLKPAQVQILQVWNLIFELWFLFWTCALKSEPNRYPFDFLSQSRKPFDFHGRDAFLKHGFMKPKLKNKAKKHGLKPAVFKHLTRTHNMRPSVRKQKCHKVRRSLGLGFGIRLTKYALRTNDSGTPTSMLWFCFFRPTLREGNQRPGAAVPTTVRALTTISICVDAF